MISTRLLTFFFLIVLSFVIISGVAMDQLSDKKRTLSVSADGEIRVKPDICYVNLRITAKDRSAGVAYKNNKETTVLVLNALQHNDESTPELELGLKKSDLQTTQISLNPQYTYRKSNERNVLDSYSAELTLTIKVRNLEKVSRVLDLAVENGAQIDSMSFSVEHPEIYEVEARRKAYLSIQEKASAICTHTSMTLGKPISITDNASSISHHKHNMMRGGMEMSMMSSDGMDPGSQGGTGIEAGEIKLSHQVSMVYEIS